MNNYLLCFGGCFLSLIGCDSALSGGLHHAGRSERNLRDSNGGQKVEFKAVTFYSGRKANGADFSAGIYDSTDGVGVSSTVEVYYSAAGAKREMKRRIKTASRIIERGNKENQKGKLIGERVVLISAGNTRDIAYVTVLWVDREDLHVIESASLQHALDFERSFY
jgi:hypothetical protein